MSVLDPMRDVPLRMVIRCNTESLTAFSILVQHIERAAKQIYGIPEFRFYAIAAGIKQLLLDPPAGIGPSRPNPRANLLPPFLIHL